MDHKGKSKDENIRESPDLLVKNILINEESGITDQILLHACINSPNDMIVLAIDKQYNYLTFNEYHKAVMLQSYGIEVKPGMNIFECMTNNEDVIRAKKNFERAISGESHITVEEYGEIDRQYFETRYNPIYNEKHEIFGATAFSSNVTERKRLEESLRKSEEKFRKTFITSPDSININRLSDGMYVSVNAGFTDITGYTEKEIIGKTSLELNIWADPADRDKLVKGLKSDGYVKNLETRFRMKDNSVRIGIMSASIIELDGDPYIISITRDITQKKQIEYKLMESENRYRGLIELAPDGILLGTADGVISWANSKMLKITGRNLDELIGNDISILFSGGELKRVPFQYNQLKRGEAISNERIILRADGSEVPIEMHSKMMPDGTYQSICHDISLRRKAEQALQESEVFFKEVFDTLDVGIAYATLQGKILAANNALVDITQVPLKNIVGKNIISLTKKLLTLKDVNKTLPAVYDLLQGKNVDPFEIAYGNKVLEISASKDRKSKRITGIIRDITRLKLAEDKLKANAQNLSRELEDKRIAEVELHKLNKQLEISRHASLNLLEDIKLEIEQRKKIEEEINILNAELEQRVVDRTTQLEAANRELEAFAYSVSHDLRAPLRAIDGFSKFILEDYGTKLDAEGKRLLGLIRSNTVRMDQLISDLLALSRVTRSEHANSDIDMAKMANSMFNEAASPEVLKTVSFIIREMPGAYADSTYLKQVWINLFSNAIKFSSGKKKPKIEIGGYTKKGSHIYYIKDNGVGFNPEYSHKLFGVFQRLHKSDEFEGNGVGLAIVQRIIHRHGGIVWAEGKEGEGATFYFSLPVRK